MRLLKNKINQKKVKISPQTILSSVDNVLAGDLLLNDMVRKQYLFVLMLAGLSLFYINNRFLYEKQLKELDESEVKLENVKYQTLTITKELKVAGRRTVILDKLHNAGSDIEEALSPAIIIKD